MFEIENLSVLSNSNGFTLWHYVTEDRLHSARYPYRPANEQKFIGTNSPGYFDAASDLLKKDDVIYIQATDGIEGKTKFKTTSQVFVKKVEDGKVEIGSMTKFRGN